MQVFERIADRGHEQVVFCNDPASGLRAIIAIHSTTLGPSLGGTRFYPYDNEADALEDVLRLSRAMTYKNAVSGLDLGGGKAVIIGDPAKIRTEALIRAYARFVDGLSGRYLTAEDVGTTLADMDLIQRETPHVTGVSETLGGSGDPSPATAWGVYWAMKATAMHLWGSDDLAGKHVVVTGVGKVGSALVGHLASAGAKVSIADINPAATESVASRYGATVIELDDAASTECDIFAPCALGGALSEQTIPTLRCAAIVGSANNQLHTDEDAERLHDRGVLFAPDFLVNAGGVTNISEELAGYDRDRAFRRIEGFYDTTLLVLQTADAERVTPVEAAVRVAERRIDDVGRVARIRTSRDGS